MHPSPQKEKESVLPAQSEEAHITEKKEEGVVGHQSSTPTKADKREAVDQRPLAERMRPTTFDELYVLLCAGIDGQGNAELFSKGSVVRTLLEKDPPPSVIFCGTPGCGKTTVAHIIALHTKCPFYSLSCCIAGTDEIKSIADKAENEYRLRKVPSILFMDEIHRFNKKQQDLFLPYVESGRLILIGATTENPSFSINSVIAIPYGDG